MYSKFFFLCLYLFSFLIFSSFAVGVQSSFAKAIPAPASVSSSVPVSALTLMPATALAPVFVSAPWEESLLSSYAYGSQKTQGVRKTRKKRRSRSRRWSSRRSSRKKKKEWNLFVGNSYLMRQLSSVTDARDGEDKSFYGEIKTPTFLEFWMPLRVFPGAKRAPKDYFFVPYLGYTIFGFLVSPDEDEDGGSLNSMIILGTRVVGPLIERVQWTSGLGLQFYSLYGKGGKVTLNDGTGKSEFYLASRDSTTRNYYLSGGLRFKVYSHHYIQLNLNILTPFFKLKRSYDLALGWFFHVY